MDNDKRFNKIVKEISDEERVSLLDKFTKISSSSDGNEKPQSQNTIDQERNQERQNQQSYLASIYNKTSFFSKIIIFISSIFSGMPKEEIILNNELKNLKRNINLKYNNIVDFEKEKLTHNFIKELIVFIKSINEIKPILQTFFDDPLYYYEFLSIIIERNLSEKTKEILADLSPETLEIKIEYMDKSIFTKEKDKRQKKFLLQLDAIYFDKLLSQFNKFELFLKLMRFEYDSLLKLFFVFDVNEPLSSTNCCEFKNAQEIIERFYRILYSINFIFDEISFVYDMVDYSNNFPAVPKNQQKNPQHQLKFTEDDLSELKKTLENIQILKENIPFTEIIAYFKHQLLYKPKMIKSKIDFIDIYKEYKKTLVNVMWENYYGKIRLSNLEKLVNDLFTTYDYNSLNFFTIELKNKIEKFSTIKVKHSYTINFLFEFIKSLYKPKIEVIINKCLIDGIFKKDVQKSNLSVAYYTLTNSLDRIKEFDAKFDPEKDVGKKVSMTLRRLATDSAFKASLINIVTDLNDETTKLIFEFYECLNVVCDFLKNTIDVNNPKNMTITNLDKIKIPGYIGSFIAIEQATKTMDLFMQIYTLIEEIY